MKFIAKKTDDGRVKGKLSMYCRVLNVTRQGFYKYIKNKDKDWKYQYIADEIYAILEEDTYNDTYGRYRMHEAIKLRHENDNDYYVPSERTIYRIMQKLNICNTPKRNPQGITKVDKKAQKSDDKIKRDFTADKPLKKCVTDITEIKAKDGKLYTSAIFDCFDTVVLGLAMDTNMKAQLCEHTLDNAYKAYPDLRGAIVHSDRGVQYTSELYRNAVAKYGINQSMNSDRGRCHDNARCESMWARLKEEVFYSRGIKSTDYTIAELKLIIWRYFMSYWNNRRICSSNGGLPPMIKRERYYSQLHSAKNDTHIVA